MGKVEESVKILEKIAEINKVHNPEIRMGVEEYVKATKYKRKDNFLSFLELFSKPVIRLRTVLMTLA